MRPGPTRRLLAILAARTNIPEQFHHDGVVIISLHKVQDGFRIRELSAKEVDTLETKPLGHIIGELDNLQDRGSDVGHVLEGKKEVLEELAHLVLDPVFLLEVDFILIVELQVLLKILP